MYYTIYVTYNLINGKEYIGKHQTQNINDNYLGSGKLIRSAIDKYGGENFVKDVLFVFKTEQEMNNKEKELVTEEYIKSKLSYNLCPGGHGGFGYINSNSSIMNTELRIVLGKRAGEIHKTKIETDINYKNYRRSIFDSKYVSSFRVYKPPFKSKKHTKETKFLMSEKAKLKVGSKNSQYGTCWITNGTDNKKIKKEELASYISQGYYKGRIYNS